MATDQLRHAYLRSPYLNALKADGARVYAGDEYEMIVQQAIGELARTAPYSNSKRYQLTANGAVINWRRLDCTGTTSVAMGFYLDGPGSWGGGTTETLPLRGAVYEIPLKDVRSGDFVGFCAPGSAGNGGHMAVVESRTAAGGYACIEHGAGVGPYRKTRNTLPSDYDGWRYALLAGGMRAPLIHTRTWRQGSYGGPVRDIQQLLGLSIDGNFGPVTHGAVEDYQRANGLTVDGIVGPVTGEHMALALYGPDPAPPPPVDHVTFGTYAMYKAGSYTAEELRSIIAGVQLVLDETQN